MKILYVTPGVPVPHTGEFTGGSTHVMKIAESMVKKGNEVYIISRRSSKYQKKIEQIQNNILTRRVYRGLLFPIGGKASNKKIEKKLLDIFIEQVYFLLYRFLLTFLAIYMLKKYKIDIIIDRSSSKGIGVFAGRLTGIPVALELLDPDYSRFSLKLADKIFAYTKEIVDPRYHDKTEIVSAGVDTEIFKPLIDDEIRERYNLTNKMVVVYVGAKSAWHGPEVLIDSAAKFSDDVRFLMVGKGLDTFKEKAEKLEVLNKFVFTGFVKHEEIPKYIASADVTVAPYDPKGFQYMDKYGFYFSPIKIFEYMACGKPLVTSDLEIIRDIIKESKCGLLAKPGDTNDLAEKINLLLDDKQLRKEFGKNARKSVIKNYTWDDVADKIIKL